MRNSIDSEEVTFSILMANYNNAKFIEEAINSVIFQIYQEWELIIVDDCSTDDSIEKINKFLGNKKIKLIRHKYNEGYGGALRTAANNASNLILGILDSDDKLHDNALKIVAEAYQKHPDVGFIYSTMWICDSEMKNCVIKESIGPIIPEKTSIFKTNISHFKTFRRAAYQKTTGFDPNQKKAVDKDIIYKLEEITNLKYINKPLYYYRSHQGGISQGRNMFQARVYWYIAKCKAYQRRLNTGFPNLTLKYLYTEYYKIMFHSLIVFKRSLFKILKISMLIAIFFNKFPNLPKNKRRKVKILIK